jgi:hypothetical protein
MANLDATKQVIAAFRQKHAHHGPVSVNYDELFELVSVLEQLIGEIETKVPSFKDVDRLTAD